METTRLRDVRMAMASDLEQAARTTAPPPRCAVCDRRLPNSIQRRHCLEHSDYAQRLMQQERRRRSRRIRVRRAA